LLTITVAVTPGTNPTSTGLSVDCDLSWLRLGPSSPLFDDGTHGDTTAGDLTFTVQATIPLGTVPGTRIGACHVFDAESRAGSTSYSVHVVPIALNSPPTGSAGGPYSVDEGGTVSVTASGSDPEGGPLTYAWDLDDDGSFETTGQAATFSAADLDGPGTRTIHVRVTDNGGLFAVADATVTILNVTPTATFSAPATAFAGFPFMLSLANPHDPSVADGTAGFQYAFDCGSGYGPFGVATTASCLTADTGSRSVGGKIRDKDGGVTEYRGTVRVVVTVASLCDLVRAYSTDPKAAADLCDKLAKAERAPNANARAGHLTAFRNKVDAKTGTQAGKALTDAQAVLLKLLSTRL
jgi:hypothetical protein